MGPRAIGDHGAPVSLPKLKKAYEKGTRGISWGPLLTPGPKVEPEFPNGQSAPAHGHMYIHTHRHMYIHTQTHVHTDTCTYVHTNTHMYIHTYTCTHIHKYT
ncbi:unnamed protein product, partial [Staurois parvus]